MQERINPFDHQTKKQGISTKVNNRGIKITESTIYL
jgi:hypothetical protein